jgi:hypothetical protein
MPDGLEKSDQPTVEQKKQNQGITFWITANYYGGDVDLIAQAARDCSAELVAVHGFALADYPGDREYVEGEAQYLFMLSRDATEGAEVARREAGRTVQFAIRDRVRVLDQQKYGDD